MASLSMSFQPTKTLLHSVDDDYSCNQNETQNRHVRFDSKRNKVYTIEPLFDCQDDIWWKGPELELIEKLQQQHVTRIKPDVADRNCSLILDFLFSKKNSIFFFEIPTAKPPSKQQQNPPQQLTRRKPDMNGSCTLILDYLFSKKSIFFIKIPKSKPPKQQKQAPGMKPVVDRNCTMILDFMFSKNSIFFIKIP